MSELSEKPQRWRPLGRVVAPTPTAPWWESHASYPTAMSLPDGSVRIYFSIRDVCNKSSLASLDVEVGEDNWSAIGPVVGPLFGPGPRGAFDADGVTVTSVLRAENKLYAYYLGWTVGGAVPFTNFIGLAIAESPGSAFRRWSPAPVVGRSRENPFTVGYPWVLRDAHGYRMWFGSHLSWGAADLAMTHVVKEACSKDGLAWAAGERVVLGLKGVDDPAEFAVSRPAVLAERDGSYAMWYARRKPHYALGFARSVDGVGWSRCDDRVTFSGTPEAWEDAERTYPCVFDHGNRRYMLYNGNGYGRTGFGLAVLED